MDPTGGRALCVLVTLVLVIVLTWVFASEVVAVGVTVFLAVAFLLGLVYVFSNTKFS